MKRNMTKLMALLLSAGMTVTSVPVTAAETNEAEPQTQAAETATGIELSQGDVVVLYTNDIHNAYTKGDGGLGYASVAWYKKNLESQGYKVELVDNGDAIQGGVIGALSKGSYIVDIMEQTGYTLAIPGNHEFDFGMDNFLTLAKDASYQYICSNFTDLKTNKTVFDPYVIEDYAGKKVAYLGITTPETFTKSTPTYFQDENGTYIYGFEEGNNGQDLYDCVQDTIDEIEAQGVEYIVALAHTGVDPSSTPWTSKEIIANTTGIDAYLDGHSHTTLPSELVKDEAGKDVLLTSTGTKLGALGEMVIHADGTMESTLVTEIPEEDAETKTFVDGITAQFEELTSQVVATSEVDLVVNDPATGNRLVRSQETNLGDLCADAYRTMLGADVAFVNGGGVRANMAKGDITYGDIIAVHPFGNLACMVEATGQQILDALEVGARGAGTSEVGGFLQASGLTYEIDTRVPSSVVLDDKGAFVSVNGAYRVKNVMVGGEALDLTKTYKLASHNYMLKSGGDGFSMFQGDTILKDEVMVDNEVLITYIKDTLGGKITAENAVANPYGEGRIKVVTDSKDATCTTEGSITYVQGSGTVTDTIPVIAHTEVVTKPAVAATCTKAGRTEEVSCSVCGTVIKAQKTIPALGHKLTTINKKAATYFEKGYTGDKYCTRCKKTITKGKAVAKKVLKKPVITAKVKSGALNVSYKKVTGAKSYQIAVKIGGRWATFTSKTTSTKIKGLAKGKKYQVKVRAVVTSGVKIAYSSYSKTKTVTVK